MSKKVYKPIEEKTTEKVVITNTSQYLIQLTFKEGDKVITESVPGYGKISVSPEVLPQLKPYFEKNLIKKAK